MKSFKNILVITEDIGQNQTLLHKALTLAHRAKASLTIMANNQDNEIAPHLELIYQQKIADLAMLNGYQASRLNMDINIKYCAAPFSHQAILAEITEHAYDLLIKDIHSAHFQWGLSWSDNYYLLREGETNLLLVGETQWPNRGKILAALETEELTEKHQQLNHFMIDESQYLATLLNSEVHLLNCYQEQPSISLADQLFAGGFEEPLQQHWRHLQDSALRYGLQPEQIHVEPGLPEYVIPHQAKKHHANIVTLGAGEHHGLIDLLKGHSCEYVVDGLACDALILKANRCNAQ
ncbi:universal stress protein [Colwellia sp. MB3u-4]|uniref:universal stress protein n=1 Tax=Colwellia sp. MB3u-4 TaxID=2759822 RepID=UPI0015F4FD50|nr:universal stress protein [Colwellia sp. MB3u-4]MBA6289451.1 universal stress protein [Colwellia sp. MB3u-4]